MPPFSMTFHSPPADFSVESAPYPSAKDFTHRESWTLYSKSKDGENHTDPGFGRWPRAYTFLRILFNIIRIQPVRCLAPIQGLDKLLCDDHLTVLLRVDVVEILFLLRNPPRTNFGLTNTKNNVWY